MVTTEDYYFYLLEIHICPRNGRVTSSEVGFTSFGKFEIYVYFSHVRLSQWLLISC